MNFATGRDFGYPIGDALRFLNERGLILLFGVALLCRLSFFTFASLNNGLMFGTDFPDSAGYDQLAMNLVAGNGFSQQSIAPYIPDTFRTPVYPFFLSVIYWVFGHRPYVAILFQIVIGVLTCMVTLLLERQILGENGSGYSGWMLAAYPTSIVFDNTLLSESLFTCLLALSIFYYVSLVEKTRLKDAFACGILLGLATLCRPIAVYLGVVLIGYLALGRIIHRLRIEWRRLLVLCVCLFAGFGAIVYPWMERNRAITGVREISSFYGNASAWVGPLALVRSNRSGRSVGTEWSDILQEYKTITDRSEGSKTIEQRNFRNRAIQEILDAQPPYWKLLAWGMSVTLFSPQTFMTSRMLGIESGDHIDARRSFSTIGLWKFLSSIYSKKRIYEMIYLGFFIVFSLILYLSSLYCVLNHYRQWTVIVLCLMVCYFIFLAGAIGEGRFRVPAMPFFAVLSSWGLHRLRKGFIR